MLSARNQFKGTVKEVKLGNVMAEVVVTAGRAGYAFVDSKSRGRSVPMHQEQLDAAGD